MWVDVFCYAIFIGSFVRGRRWESNNDLGCTEDQFWIPPKRVNFYFARLAVDVGRGERLVSSELDTNCPPERLWRDWHFSPLLSSPLQLVQWQVHVEKRDNQLPSLLCHLCPSFILPVSLSNPVPRHFLSTTLNLLSFSLLFLTFSNLYLVWLLTASSS